VLTPTAFPFNRQAPVAPEVAWTRSSPAATLVLREHSAAGFSGDTAVLLRLRGPLDPAACRG